MAQLKSVEFRKERERVWLELEGLVEMAEKGGLRKLSADELARLPVLYRATVSSLSVAKSISLDNALLQYLEALTGRAYVCVYGTRNTVAESVLGFFTTHFPRAVRAYKGPILLAFIIMCLGVATAWVVVLGDLERFYTFVGPEYAQGRDPAASTESLREVLYDGGEQRSGALGTFAATLFSNNARVGILSFAFGFVAGIPSFFLMFLNGLILGAFSALYASRGLGMELWAWLLPHGVTELGAIILCGGAGLALGKSLVFPGEYSRVENLKRTGKEVVAIVMGAVVMLFIAGLIEGIFRQRVTDVGLRWTVATLTFTLWATYFTLAGRGPGKVATEERTVEP